MDSPQKNQYIVIGLALFAMFFGSGNLIYPLYVGFNSTNSCLPSMIGFLLTGAFMPFLGVIAMLLFNGNYFKFFSILGKKIGFLFIFLLLLVFIPFGSAPRCIALSFSSVSSYLNIGSIWMFSIVYSFLVYLVIVKKYGFINILGKIITPLLIGSILYIFIKGIFFSNAQELNQGDFSYAKGLVEGYNTMDLIASFFFSATIISMLNKQNKSKKESIKITIKSSMVAVLFLSLIYASLIIVSKKNAMVLVGVNKDQMLSVLAKSVLGTNFSIISLFSILLACFSTSVALIVVFSEFLHEHIFKNKRNYKFSVILSILITYVVSLFGLNGITKISSPVLKVFYPILLVLIFVNILLKIKKSVVLKIKNRKIINSLKKNKT
ncbi:MAG: Branched-chain amino acid transport system 2 carrier protein [Candidatus Anoxychlamydiales bacterium]|nr:Branched-chain amino acid transport system 2 carrier protein [Candidatus Anoxychlamydiales bacterium]